MLPWVLAASDVAAVPIVDGFWPTPAGFGAYGLTKRCTSRARRSAGVGRPRPSEGDWRRAGFRVIFEASGRRQPLS